METFAGHARSGWVLPAPDDTEPRGAEVPAAPSADALEYGHALVSGVQEHQSAIDALLAAYADRWAIQRMPVVDRTLLRMAVFELLWRDDIPVAVAINEAVELAKQLSTDDSGRFINGLLGRIAEQEIPAEEGSPAEPTTS